eukprot:1139897-Pelagomonas_calceolata.AAC.6
MRALVVVVVVVAVVEVVANREKEQQSRMIGFNSPLVKVCTAWAVEAVTVHAKHTVARKG